MLSEKEFIKAIQDNQQIIVKVCNLYTDNPADREDLFQEILFNAWKGNKNYKGNAKFSTWLYKVALNTSITFFKKDKRKSSVFSKELPGIEPPDLTDPLNEQAVAMNKAINELSEIDKALVMLYLEEYDYQEIADIMGISVNNVAVKMNRIKAKLKENSKKYL
jgi:RNA polymerase sigma-70 factor (ECF subfamily)